MEYVLWAYMWIIIIRALLSWVNPDPWNPIVRFLYQVTEPVLRPIRRRLPYTAIDFSPLIVILGDLVPPAVPGPRCSWRWHTGSGETRGQGGTPMRMTATDIRQQQFAVTVLPGVRSRRRSTRSSRRWPTTSRSWTRENELLKEQLLVLEERSRGVEGREKTLQETLVTTQKIAEEFKENSRREAELVLREAQLRAEKLLQRAREEHARLTAEISRLRRLRRQLGEEILNTPVDAQAARRAGAGGGRWRRLRRA